MCGRGCCKNATACIGLSLAECFACSENLQFDANREARLQYTIESRPLTNSPSSDGAPRQMIIDAADAHDAVQQFVLQSASELVSVTTPAKGSESIATVRKDDSVFLLRVYAA
jgi:hypothetical protein